MGLFSFIFFLQSSSQQCAHLEFSPPSNCRGEHCFWVYATQKFDDTCFEKCINYKGRRNSLWYDDRRVHEWVSFNNPSHYGESILTIPTHYIKNVVNLAQDCPSEDTFISTLAPGLYEGELQYVRQIKSLSKHQPKYQCLHLEKSSVFWLHIHTFGHLDFKIDGDLPCSFHGSPFCIVKREMVCVNIEQVKHARDRARFIYIALDR